jgi:large subunit ribosomal protein L13
MMSDFKTYSKKASDVTHKWVLVDAAGQTVGRLATFIATRLSGKYQPTFTPHMDSGDYVVVINADQAALTGAKNEAKTYYRHSGYPGSIKSRTAAELTQAEVIWHAVRGMLPKNKLQPDRLARLRIFAGAEHDHSAQQPEPVMITKEGKRAAGASGSSSAPRDEKKPSVLSHERSDKVEVK